jgi:hypothetical protein
MVYLFEQKAAATPPAEVTVQVVRHTWRQNSLDQTMNWFDPAVVAQATLPMVESAQQVAEKKAAQEKAAKKGKQKKRSGDSAGTGTGTGTGTDRGAGTGGDA